jgi:hypothetical protein
VGKAELLKDLREKIGSLDLSPREVWASPSFAPRVTRGIVAELLGTARTEWLLELFHHNPEPLILWWEREPSANPLAIQQRGVNLERIKFINSAGNLQQPLRLALESGHYPFIVAPTRFDDTKTFQRLHLLAEKAKSTLFLLADEEFSQAWPISLQLEINFSDEGLHIEVHRQKHGAFQ